MLLTPRRRTLPLFVCCGAVAGLACTSAAQWVPPYWQFERIGLLDADHTRLGGGQRSTATSINTDGLVVGTSSLYFGGTNVRGTSVWAWTPETHTVRLGFWDAAEHGGDFNNQLTQASKRGTAVVGNTRRYRSGGVFNGQTAWIWTPTLGNTRLGYVDAEHTGDLGYRYSIPHSVNSAGRATGSSVRFTAGVEQGNSAWTWSEVTGYAQVGFVHGDHVRSDGYRFTELSGLSEAGHVIGFSRRYAELQQIGGSGWIWSPDGSLTALGIQDAEHTATNGTTGHFPRSVNSSGRVVGTSSRYLGQTNLGLTAWTWTQADGHSAIGLTDSAHVRTDGFRTSTPNLLNEASHIAGTSTRYAPGGGQSAWRWTAGETQRIGLFDAEHTLADGFQSSTPIAMNSKAETIGTSVRTMGSGGATFKSAWLVTEDNTHRLGLFDGLHTASNGNQNSEPLFITENAVVGLSTQYVATGNTDLSTWYYDILSEELTHLVFSMSPTGLSETAPAILTESGWVVGRYTNYDVDPLGQYRGFLWSQQNGMSDLGALLEGGMPPAGWGMLEQMIGGAEYRAIAGNARLSSAIDACYALTVPAPATACIGLPGLLALCRRRTRPT